MEYTHDAFPIYLTMHEKKPNPCVALCNSHETCENLISLLLREKLRPPIARKNGQNLKHVFLPSPPGKWCAEGAYFFSSKVDMAKYFFELHRKSFELV